MAGILVQLALSWLLLWLVEKKDLAVLGLWPLPARLWQGLAGLLVAAACCTLYYMGYVTGLPNRWAVNEAFTTSMLAGSAWYTLKSVLFEELLFRGALLYLLLQRLKALYACLISAIAFGVYHWFTMGFGNPLHMLLIFITTGIWGFMLAMAYARTRSLYLPIGLHLGWNFVNMVIFSQGPLGPQYLLLQGEAAVGGLWSLVLYLFQVLALPLLVWWYLARQRTAAL